ncbi:MAG: response regulator transcription factor [Flavobacteriales bacterium]
MLPDKDVKPTIMASFTLPSGVTGSRTLIVLAMLGSAELTDDQLQAGSVGYIVEGNSPTELMGLVEELRKGHEPANCSARRVTVQLRPEEIPAEVHRLTRREIEVLRALVDGLSYKMIAVELSISFETVRSHVKVIYRKMNVNNNTAAVAKAIHCGLVAA